MKALVTGGAGFIGSHLADALVAAGAEVHVIDDFSSGRLENLGPALERGAQLHTADVTDAPAMTALLAAVRPNTVFHLAAHIDVRRSVSEPEIDAFANVVGTIVMLEAARRAGARRLVMASTAAVYGNPERLPTTERVPAAPLSPYGVSKASAELYLELYARRGDLATLALRMANVYGPRQDPHGEAGVVAIFSSAAAAGRPVTIFGDGRQTRDYVHVSDVVTAFVAAAEAPVTGALNVSTGRETAVLGVAEALGVAVEHGPARPGEIARSCLDPAAAERALGWRARTRLRDGLRPLGAPAWVVGLATTR